MNIEIITAIIGASGVIAGAFLGSWLQREAKKIASLERRIDRYRTEIRARQAEEGVAAKWLHELGVGSTENSAKLALRERTELETGQRPSIGAAEVRHMGS